MMKNDIPFTKKTTSIPGLTHEPSIISNDSDINNKDIILEYVVPATRTEVSDQNFALMSTLAQKYSFDNILEIGVNRNKGRSFTRALIKDKPIDSTYIGIDIEDKSYLDSINNNIYTIKESSFNTQNTRGFFESVNVKTFSLIHIDGWHSVNALINDWQYSDMLCSGGIVVLHDTNFHPGPKLILEAIDKKLFRIERHFTEDIHDWGMSVVYKLS